MQSYWCSISPYGTPSQHEVCSKCASRPRADCVLAVRSCRLPRARRSAGALYSQVAEWANAFVARLFGVEGASSPGIPDNPMPSGTVLPGIDGQNCITCEIHFLFEEILKVLGVIPPPGYGEWKRTVSKTNVMFCERLSQISCTGIGNIAFWEHLPAYSAIAFTCEHRNTCDATSRTILLNDTSHQHNSDIIV